MTEHALHDNVKIMHNNKPNKKKSFHFFNVDSL